MKYDEAEYRYRIYLYSILCSMEEMIDVMVLSREEYFRLSIQTEEPNNTI